MDNDRKALLEREKIHVRMKKKYLTHCNTAAAKESR